MSSAREKADLIVDTIAQSGVSLTDEQWDIAVDIIAAALLAEREAGIEEAATLTENAWACRSCGAVFHQYDNPHGDEDCPKGRASWESATKPQVASALRGLIKQKEERG